METQEERKARRRAERAAERTWTREEAHRLVEHLTPFLAARKWGLGLTGSLLTKPASTKDLDLVVYPFNTETSSEDEAREALTEAGLRFELDVEFVQGEWRKLGSADQKRVDVWFHGTKRIDVFWLR